MSPPPSRLAAARRALLAARNPAGHWEGELSSSALSTATAVCALSLWRQHTAPNFPGAPAPERLDHAISHGLRWLADHANPDGGWGDTVLSFSNISTTALCWAAFGAVPGADVKYAAVVQRAEAWLAMKCSVISNQGSVIRDQGSVPKPSSAPSPTDHLSLITNHSPRPLDRSALTRAIIARYGKDRTFSVPILTMCALAGRLGAGKEAWEQVIQLPFELAALPPKFFAALRLPVVSYALPALIAIGQARHFHRPTRNPLLRLLRDRARAKTLDVLERIQPPNGGFLEATPLTSFVTMSLAGSGQADHLVASRGVRFLLQSQRGDGSWPIDTNLATWVTTLAINALGPSIHDVMSATERQHLLDWLLAQQYRTVHPYTNAPPGGWAWTDLTGGVPDADDTAGALLALKHRSFAPGFNRVPGATSGENCLNSFSPSGRSDTRLKPGANEKGTAEGKTPADSNRPQISASQSPSAVALNLRENFVDPRVHEAVIAGVTWLLNLQNRDGGIPTFCRGWTNLPFDRSSPDLTAHALRAWLAWRDDLPADLQQRLHTAIPRAIKYLARTQSPDGSWLPLWFGNQHALDDENPTYGTARVVVALEAIGRARLSPARRWDVATIERRAEDRRALPHDAPEQSKAAGGASSPRPDLSSSSDHTMLTRGLTWFVQTQQADGGWSGAHGAPSSVEETALAVECLASPTALALSPAAKNAAARGAKWLEQKIADGTWTQPSPIGFYFAKLWYFERLYPVVFTVAALEAVGRLETAER